MFTVMALSLAIGAPVPKAAPPAPAGLPPHVLELKPDADGKVKITVLRTETRKVQVQVVGPNGQVVPETREVPYSKYETVEIGDVKDLTITTADGKKLDKDDAMKKLVAGAVVVASSDGKPVSPLYLKVFKDDTLVLSSPELVTSPTVMSRPNIRIAPAAGGALPAAVPATVPVQPPPPPPPAKPAPAAPAKPVEK